MVKLDNSAVIIRRVLTRKGVLVRGFRDPWEPCEVVGTNSLLEFDEDVALLLLTALPTSLPAIRASLTAEEGNAGGVSVGLGVAVIKLKKKNEIVKLEVIKISYRFP